MNLSSSPRLLLRSLHDYYEYENLRIGGLYVRKLFALYFPLIVIFMSVMQGCSSSSSSTSSTKSTNQSAEEVIQQYINGWAENDPASVTALFSDYGLYKDPTYPQGIRGEELEEYITYVWKRYQGQTFKSNNLKKIDDTHYTFEWWIENGNGSRSITGYDTVEIEDGKIALLQGAF
ncbi:SnoaL-like domain protein [compost metagenome]